MKKPDEIKKGLECCIDYQSCTEYGEPKCPYNDATKCMEALLTDNLAYIQQLESNASQVSKALCDKENATLEEMLEAVSQLKQNATTDWISVHDEPPPKGSRVLVLMDDHGKTSMMVANYGKADSGCL